MKTTKADSDIRTEKLLKKLKAFLLTKYNLNNSKHQRSESSYKKVRVYTEAIDSLATSLIAETEECIPNIIGKTRWEHQSLSPVMFADEIIRHAIEYIPDGMEKNHLRSIWEQYYVKGFGITNLGLTIYRENKNTTKYKDDFSAKIAYILMDEELQIAKEESQTEDDLGLLFGGTYLDIKTGDLNGFRLFLNATTEADGKEKLTNSEFEIVWQYIMTHPNVTDGEINKITSPGRTFGTFKIHKRRILRKLSAGSKENLRDVSYLHYLKYMKKSGNTSTKK